MKIRKFKRVLPYLGLLSSLVVILVFILALFIVLPDVVQTVLLDAHGSDDFYMFASPLVSSALSFAVAFGFVLGIATSFLIGDLDELTLRIRDDIF